MSFTWPVVLVALLAVPLLVRLLLAYDRRRRGAAASFTSAALLASVAPSTPGRRRHLPAVLFVAALTVLVIGAARPRTSSAVPVTGGAVMLVDDVSASMAATDVHPSRLGAALDSARRFVDRLPSTLSVGVEKFSVQSTVLQSPSTDHSLARQALQGLAAGGHTAIGDALNTAIDQISRQRTPEGGRPPGAIVLISDGKSTQGADPLTAAQRARGLKISIYTVAVGTAQGTIPGSRGPVPVPLDPTELTQIAAAAGGRAFSATDAGALAGVYTHLAAQIGHRQVHHEITGAFAGGALLLLLMGSGMSLFWFGRLV